MKKYLALLLALVLAFGVVLSACGGDKAPETTAPKADAGNDATDAPTDAPDDGGDEPAEIRQITAWGINPLYGMEMHAWENWMVDENPMWVSFQEKMTEPGLELVIEEIDNVSYPDTAKNRLNAQLDLPDIMNMGDAGYSQAEMAKLGQDGLFMELIEAFETYDEDGSIMEWLSKYPSFPSVLDENGDLWFMPYTNGGGLIHDDGSVGLGSSYSFQIRYDWMEALGIEYKYFYTPEEIFDILKAFRDQDANGNGIADEVVSANIGDHNFSYGFGIGPEMIFVTSDGTCMAQIDHPNFTAMVEFYQKLYNEGIISPDQFNEGWAPTAANRSSGLFSYQTQSWEEAGIAGYEDTAYYVPVVIDDDAGENGYMLPWCDATSGMLAGWAINKDADAEAIVDLIDWMCSMEFVEWSWGVEGEHWEYNENGDKVVLKNFDGADPTNCDLGGKVFFNMIPNVTWNVPSKDTFVQNNYASGSTYEKYPLKCEAALATVIEDWGKYTYCSSSGFYAMFTVAEKEAYDAVATDVSTYWSELMTDLLTGEKSIDDLATYRAELTELGLDTMIKIQQDRAARFFAAAG